MEVKIKTRIIDNDKFLENYITLLTEIEDFMMIVYDDRYVKTKIRTYGNNVYTTFRSLGVAANGVECEPFTVTSIESYLFV